MTNALFVLLIVAWLLWLTHQNRRRHKGSLRLGVRRVYERRTIVAKPLEMNDKQKADLGISPTDLDGRPLPSASAAAWSSSNPDIVTLVVADNGLSAIAQSGPAPGQGAFGTATVSVVLGDLTETIDITVIPTAPGALNLTAGIPMDE